MDIKRKLTSRKFWALICNQITCILAFTNYTEDEKGRIISLIMATAGVIAYMLAEGFTDMANTNTVEDDEDDILSLADVEFEDEEE